MLNKVHWLAFSLLAFLACSRDGILTTKTPLPLDEPVDGAEIRFGKILSDAELIPGPGATGWFGDFKFYNSRAGFIFQGNLNPPDRRLLPGAVIDAAWAEAGESPAGDLLSGFTPWPEDSPARLEKIEFFPGTDRSRVTAAGRLELEGLEYQVDYTLFPGQDARGPGLLIKTTISNPGSSPRTVRPGDWISFGGKLIPEVLDFPGGRKFLAAVGERMSYLYVPAGPEIDSLEISQGETDIYFPEQTLNPGQSRDFTRWLLVSRHGLTEANTVLPTLLGFSPGTLRISLPNVLEQENLTVKLFSSPDAPASVIAPDQAGNLAAGLPAGTYQVKIESPGLEEFVFPEPVTIAASGETIVTAELPLPSRVRFQVWEENDGGWVTGPSPAKLCFEKIGSAQEAVRTVTATGAGRILLAPGIYDVSASRGTEFTRDRFRFELKPGEDFQLRMVLRKVLDNTGYYSFDPRQYSNRSARGSFSREEWLKTNLAEGLSLLTPTDINSVTEISSSDPLLSSASPVFSLPGVEIQPRTGPPFLLFPAVFDPYSGWGGVPRTESPDTVRQVSLAYSGPHLLGATSEALAEMIPSPDSPTAPVRLEFLPDFISISDSESDLKRWFTLLNSGYRITAIGGSGAGSLAEGIGFVRTLVPRAAEGTDPGTGLVNAVRNRVALVSAGPRLRMRANYYAFDSYPFISDTSGDIDLEIELESPVWTPVTELILYGNGETRETIPVDFSTATALGGHRFSRRFYLNLPLERDTWFVALVRGRDSLAPVYPGSPFAFTNPIWVDSDGADTDRDGLLFDALNPPQ